MIRRFIGLCFLIFSFMICTSTALNSPAPKLEYDSYKGLSNLSNPISHEEENQGVVRSKVQYYMGKHVMKLESSEMGQRGKGTGVYGGGNVAHRPRPNKNAAKLLRPMATPFLIMITTIITSLQLK